MLDGAGILIFVVSNLLTLAVVFGAIYFAVRLAIRRELERVGVADLLERLSREPGSPEDKE